MLELIRHLMAAKARSEKGTSSVEFGLIVVAIAALITLVVFVVGKYVKAAFDTTCGGMSGNVTNTTATCP